MKKIVVRCLPPFLFFLLFQAQLAFSAEQTPEQLVRDFYAWYFKADTATEVAENNDAIYTYVDKETVAYARRTFSDGLSYFVKFGTDIDWGRMTMILGEQIAMADDAYIIPATFRAPPQDCMEDILIIVYVKKQNGAFFIYKVSDIYPYS